MVCSFKRIVAFAPAMQHGTCFLNYEDFREFFDSYKEETRSMYSIHSCITVQFHNRKHGTNIRDDIIYTQVRFRCSKLHGPNGKRKPQEVVCPAYILLQYDTTLDRLVLKEECVTHVHTKQRSQKTSPPKLPPKTVHSESEELDSPSKKIRGETISLTLDTDRNDENLKVHVPYESEESLPSDKNDDSEVDSPNDAVDFAQKDLPLEAISRLGELLKNFQTKDVGAKSLLSIGSEQQLDQISFQTSKMCDLFVKFPESLLIHKVANKRSYTFYAFLVENKERRAKVINFTFVRDDSAKEMLKMLKTFKMFNPDWQKVKIIYTDIHFRNGDVLKESFPSAKTLLSIFHTVRFIENEIKGSAGFKECLRKCLYDAIHHTSPEKLKILADQIQYKMDKDLYDNLHANWFSCELLWYMHTKKGLHFCYLYLDTLSLVIDTISSLLEKDVPMEEKIRQFVESADHFNSKGLENKRNGSLDFSESTVNSLMMIKKRPRKSLTTQTSNKSALKKSTGISRFMDSLEHKPKPLSAKLQRESDKMLASLQSNCNELAFQLCRKEWEVVQKSSQLISVQTSCILVSFLEEPHRVGPEGTSCSCYFNKRYMLPCRHILAMLLANKKLVDRYMVGVRWQKTTMKEVSHDMISAKSAEEANRRVEMINSLVMEFSNLLLQSDEREIEVRNSTLQMLLDVWHKESNHKPEPLAQSAEEHVPYRWVKKETVEGEEVPDSWELHRLDT